MSDLATPSPGAPAWLGDYLDEAVARKLCVRVGCTTCGAMEFRHGLYTCAAAAIGVAPLSSLSGHNDIAYERVRQAQSDGRIRSELARQLALLDPDPARRRNWLDAVRLILCELWRAAGDAAAEREYQPIIEGTWSGSILRAMQEHSRRRDEERRQFGSFNSPESVRARREAKRGLKQQAHAERLARRKERDRLWFEQHPRAQNPASPTARPEE